MLKFLGDLSFRRSFIRLFFAETFDLRNLIVKLHKPLPLNQPLSLVWLNFKKLITNFGGARDAEKPPLFWS